MLIEEKHASNMCFSQQDINLKVAKSSQVLHFQFREDKQWKLQQVLSVCNTEI